MQEYSMKVIAHIETDFKEKFGIPRQSGLVSAAVGKIVFEPEFKNSDALRGLNELTSMKYKIYGQGQIR